MIDTPLSLYVHLPWCERKCPYCDFNSHEITEIPEAAYLTTLLKDLRQELAGQSRRLETVFIGGGTPSLFSVESIQTLVAAIHREADLAPQAEVTLEANPGSIEASRLKGYAQAGVTRFSLGIQSFSDRCLQSLGRVHDRRAARAAIIAVQNAGATSFNLDIMHGLPEQTLEEGLEDVRLALEAQPPHLSWYQLTIEANTRFYNAPPTLPLESVLEDLEATGAGLLRAAGLQRYEVSAWARPGQECRHNLNYWRFGDYLAIGAGAHGKLSNADGEILRYAKTRSPEDYMGARGTARRGTRTLDDDDRVGEFMLNALRLAEGFSLSLFEARTGLSASHIQPRLATLVDAGLLLSRGEQFHCSPLGWRFLDDVVGRFFAD